MTPDQAAKQFDEQAKGERGLIKRFLQQCRVAIIADTRDNFKQARDPDGNAWPRLRFPRARGGDKPLLDRGQLRASVVSPGPHHIEEMGQNTFRVGTSVPYAPLHQFGGIVRPKKAKALAIPLTKEAAKQGPRQFPGRLFVVWKKGAKSGVLMSLPKTKKGQPKAQYALVKQVVVPKRPFMGFGQRLIGKITEIGTRILTRAFGGRSNQNGSQP